MTSRERILNAISHNESPLAIDFGSLHSSLHVKAYQDVIKYLISKGADASVLRK